MTRDVVRPFVREIRAGDKEGVKFAVGHSRHTLSGNVLFNLFVPPPGVLNGPNPFPSWGRLDGLVNVYSMLWEAAGTGTQPDYGIYSSVRLYPLQRGAVPALIEQASS